MVHGGSLYTEPVLIDAAVITALRGLVPLAPLHQPQNLAAIAAISQLHTGLPQIACFDTAFHHTQTKVATAFALPRQASRFFSNMRGRITNVSSSRRGFLPLRFADAGLSARGAVIMAPESFHNGDIAGTIRPGLCHHT